MQAAVLEQQHKVAQRREAERPAVRELDASSEEAIANSSDMQLVFFGTSAQRPTKNRSRSLPAYLFSVHVRVVYHRGE